MYRTFRFSFAHLFLCATFLFPTWSYAVSSVELEGALCEYQERSDITEHETQVRKYVSRLNQGMPTSPAIFLLCSLERSWETISVSKRYSQKSGPDVIVVWIRESLIENATIDLFRFLLLREHERTGVFFCASILPEYIPCEQEIDRRFANRMKAELPLAALREIASALEREGASHILTQLVEGRIAALLEYRATLEQKTPTSKLAQRASSRSPA